jgi:hypothetical protein
MAIPTLLYYRPGNVKKKYHNASDDWNVWSFTNMSTTHLLGVVLKYEDFFFKFWIVRLLALRPLLAYCASLG